MLTIGSIVDLIYLMRHTDVERIQLYVNDKYIDDITYIEDWPLGRVLCGLAGRYDENEISNIKFQVDLK